MTDLTPPLRRTLRAQAHHLDPVVTIADKGLSDTVLAEIDRSLQAHELIKIKIQGAERDDREALMQEVCSRLEASPVQHIGSILIVWRKRREDDSGSAARSPSSGRPVARKAANAKSARAFSALARRAELRETAARQRRARTPAGRRGK